MEKFKEIHSHYYPVHRTGSHSAYDMLPVLEDGAMYLLREFTIVGAGVLVGEAPDIHGMEANRRRRRQTDEDVFPTMTIKAMANLKTKN
jgi:hypothetical protein